VKHSAVGLERCVRYSHPPNSFRYCGPERQDDVRGYARGHAADGGLSDILTGFDTLYRYLIFIAGENGIKDPFDPKVVSAYWLGNALLFNARYRALERHLTDSLNLKKTLTAAHYAELISKLDLGVPHHTFHVLNVFRRTGHAAIPHTLSTMDACRISWGTVTAVMPTGGGAGRRLVVTTRPLAYARDRLTLGAPVSKHVQDVSGAASTGDAVSLHWGYVCDTISNAEMNNLRYFTDIAITLANRTI
jgi:hypothetical protein